MNENTKENPPVNVRLCFPLSQHTSAELILQGYVDEHPLTKERLERLKAYVDLMIASMEHGLKKEQG